MRRHLIDTPHRHQDNIRLREFLRIDRAGVANPATAALAKQARAPRSTRGIREFLRIDRGYRA